VAYRGDGAFGQYCVVLPEEDAVLAITSGTRDMQRVLDIAWEKLLPAFRSVPLPADDVAAGKLAARLAALEVPLPAAGTGPAGIAGKVFAFGENGAKLASVAIEPGADGDAVVFMADGTEHRIECGRGTWRTGDVAWGYYGASVIHPKTIKPLQNKNIPLYVKSFLDPAGSGTEIQAETNKDELIPSFIIKQKQLLISITPKDFSFIAEDNLAVIFNILSLEQIKINLMQNSALSFSILVDENQEQLTRLLSHLAKDYTVKYNENLSLVTIRHYDDATIALVTKDKESILTQKTRQTIRLVLQ
jgi:hypothetical protein